MTRIAILGTGKIGESLLAGLLSSGWTDVVVTVRREARAEELRGRHDVTVTLSNVEAIRGAGVVVLAVKPQDIEILLGEIGGLLTPEQTVISVAAAIPTAMIDAGILLGLSREVSTRLVVQTMLGTAKLLRDEHMHPVELRESVTSPGGTTIHAIRELEQAGVRAAFLNAINAAMERSKELAVAFADDEAAEEPHRSS